MWNFFRSKPTCPVEPDIQRWIDARFAWLEEQFGPDTPRKVQVILPTPEFFPDPYNAEPEDASVMLDRVARYMNVDPARLELTLYHHRPLTDTGIGPEQAAGPAGVYIQGATDGSPDAPKSRIGIEILQLKNPMALVATLAHEIGHELLLGQGRISPTAHDHEPLTDLLTVFLGLGIFTANSTIHDRGWTDGTWRGWSTSKQGYLDQRMFGYALAKFAKARNETRPPWMKHIRLDVRSAMKKALGFLGQP